MAAKLPPARGLPGRSTFARSADASNPETVMKLKHPIGSSAGDCAPAPSHTTERAVFRIRRLDSALCFRRCFAANMSVNHSHRLQRLHRPSVGVTQSTAKTLTDNAVTTSTLVIGQSVTITDLDVVLTINHERASDLNVYLIGPDGTRVKLFDNEGGNSGSGWQGTVLDDEAATLISANQANPPYAGSYRPEASLAVLDGKLPALGHLK